MNIFVGQPPRSVATDSQWLAPFNGSIKLSDLKAASGKKNLRSSSRLKSACKQLKPLQEILFAGKQYSVLCLFQAMDAAGKDGTIREVFSDLDPAGVRVAAFKRPTPLELSHDFLWRTNLQLPVRGEIGIFNRSYYEEVLSVRVHPEHLDNQYPGGAPDIETLWSERYQAIRDHEHHLARANTVILKFWLQVSPQEQAQRFLDRINETDKSWKFSARDLVEAGFRPQYDEALVDMLNETSRPWAPWFVIPADHKPYMRHQVAQIVQQALSDLPLTFPEPNIEDAAEMSGLAERLKAQLKKS
ncbi:MAG: PPK2 family polyphosphate:nucleotide phosphotransferase [Rhodothermales bacterium]